MKMKYAKQVGSVLLAALLGVSGSMEACCLALAEEETETISTEPETVLDDGEESTEAEITELEMVVDGETLTVTNSTGVLLTFVEASDLEEDSALEGEIETEDSEAETTQDADGGTELAFSEEDGTVHIFVIDDVSNLMALSDLALTEKIGFLFLSGTDANGDAKYYYETAGEITLDESVAMYTTGQVTVRESADSSSEALGYVDRGSEVEVLGGTSTWFLVSQGDLTGYVAARYLTTNEAEALAAVEAEENALAAAEEAAAAQAAAVQAAAAQAAAAAAAAQSSSDSDSSDSETSSTENACLTGGVLN